MPDLVHQFRTPIASIEGAGFVLEDSDLSDDRRRELVAIIRKECRRLELLVELLDFTQSGSSGNQEVDLGRLLEEVIVLCQAKADGRIRLRHTTRRCMHLLRCNPELIKQAVLIVATSAMQAIQGSGELEFSADSRPLESVIRVDVRGEELFPPRDTAILQDRTTIDLSVAQQIIMPYGGSVRVSSDGRDALSILITVPREGPGRV